MAKYRKRPVVIEAFRWTGGPDQEEDPEWILEAMKAEKVFVDYPNLQIFTLEGVMLANVGDWIIRGVQGEIYPCKPQIFEMTYELVEEDGT